MPAEKIVAHSRSQNVAQWLGRDKIGWAVAAALLFVVMLAAFAYQTGRDHEATMADLAGGTTGTGTPASSNEPIKATRHEVQRPAEVGPNDAPPAVALAEAGVVWIDVNGEAGAALGSGFLVDRQGIIVTNSHVVHDAVEARVTFNTGETYEVDQILRNLPAKDLAILCIKNPSSRLKPLVVADQLPRKGEAVWAYGAPLGLKGTLTSGGVSAIRGGAEFQEQTGIPMDHSLTWIQTSTPLSKGNSGGPLLNRSGHVVAVNTFASHGSAQNINFAISCKDVRRVLQQAGFSLK